MTGNLTSHCHRHPAVSWYPAQATSSPSATTTLYRCGGTTSSSTVSMSPAGGRSFHHSQTALTTTWSKQIVRSARSCTRTSEVSRPTWSWCHFGVVCFRTHSAGCANQLYYCVVAGGGGRLKCRGRDWNRSDDQTAWIINLNSARDSGLAGFLHVG